MRFGLLLVFDSTDSPNKNHPCAGSVPDAKPPRSESLDPFPHKLSGLCRRGLRVSVAGIAGIRLHDENPVTVPAGEIGSRTASVRADPGATKPGAIPISFRVEDVADPAVAVIEKSKFWMH